MIINTNRILLRPFDKKDVNSYFHLAQSRDVKKYVYPLYVETKEKAKLRIEAFQALAARPDDFVFAIEEKTQKALIGVIDAIHIVKDTLDISLFIAESCRNRGYAKEAVNALLLKLIELKKAYKLEFFVADGNVFATMLMKHIKLETERLGLKIKEERLDFEGIIYSLQL